jgi:methionyl aminopeptidase
MIDEFVIAGVTTEELNQRMAEFIAENNAISAPLNYLGYPKETCISINEVVCHGIPGNRKLKKGDILNIDVTTILDSFYGDTSRMFTVGKISKEARALIDVTKTCLDIGIENVMPGEKTGRIGYEITKYAEALGYGVVHQFCGHGVGIKFHEPPQICHRAKSPKEGVLMYPGMVFTIEPMINIGQSGVVIGNDGWTATTIDDTLSAQYEHTLLVTENGVEVLTSITPPTRGGA